MRAKKDNGADTATTPFFAVAALNGNVSSALMEAQAELARAAGRLRHGKRSSR